ncbi:hypothetical protein N510_000455 [Firmicutes bacterium ASF500]|nr:hypothetical protein N510_000455 [Firmicutes bacterium ASF500]
MAERHETFYSEEEALACQAQHTGADIIARKGHGMMLNGEWSYVIPEDRPSWTVYWDEDVLNRYFYTFGSDPGFPYQNGWVEVRATSREEAERKFRARFPDRPGHEGIMNYAFCYNEQRWAEMDPEHTWHGWKCFEVIE